jgi:uncharacterized membrane protein
MTEETAATDSAKDREDAHPRGRQTVPQAALRTTRLEAFSDGVFAIAITLLVLEIGIPDGGGSDESVDLWQAVLGQWPSYLAYVVSFASIGAAWIAHSLMTDHLERVDATFLRINLLLLLVVAFLPFPTRLLAEYIGQDQQERVAVTFYGATLITTSALIGILWRWAARAGLTRPDVDDQAVRLVAERLTPGIGGYVVLMVVGQWFTLAAVVGFLVIAIFFLIPFPLRGRDGRSRGGRHEQGSRSRQIT